ncbi:hypothetical protein PHET_11119 [Paragonimus heterotremus]|uniref:Uncharacterized protein n=1 Tax=Paragonimus heterotremus TaxID=100268 RepID=A0A8J4SYS9_9TREM|nr:hypothetical protein PHET_11119 [Paragonimus heterotremus]
MTITRVVVSTCSTCSTACTGLTPKFANTLFS